MKTFLGGSSMSPQGSSQAPGVPGLPEPYVVLGEAGSRLGILGGPLGVATEPESAAGACGWVQITLGLHGARRGCGRNGLPVPHGATRLAHFRRRMSSMLTRPQTPTTKVSISHSLAPRAMRK